MKNKKAVNFLVVIFSVLFIFTGCVKGDANKNAINNKNELSEESAETKVNEKEIIKEKETSKEESSSNEELAAAAKAEGVSVKEMEKMIKELTEREAKKYSITVEEYTKTIKTDGLTPFTAQKQVAEAMGITITELYKYESTNKIELTEEQKENNANLKEALKEIEDLDIEKLESDMDALVKSTGVNTGSGELREVTGDIKELLSYEVSEILYENEDENCIERKYNTNKEFDDLFKYFDTLLKDTENYMSVSMSGSNESAINGTINGDFINIIIEKAETVNEVSFAVEKKD